MGMFIVPNQPSFNQSHEENYAISLYIIEHFGGEINQGRH